MHVFVRCQCHMKGRYWGPDGGRKQTDRSAVCVGRAVQSSSIVRISTYSPRKRGEGEGLPWAPLLRDETGALSVYPARGEAKDSISPGAESGTE